MFDPGRKEAHETELNLLHKGKYTKLPEDPEATSGISSPSPQTINSKLGIYLCLLGICANLGFSTLRKLIPEVSSTQFMFDRAFGELSILIAYFVITKQTNSIKESFDYRVVLIGTGSCFADCLYFVALIGLSMGEMTTILAMMAIFNGIIANIALGDPYLRIEKILGGISFIGVFFIVRPPFIFGSDTTSAAQAQDAQDPSSNLGIPRFLAAMIALFVAFAWSSLRVAIRGVKERASPIMIAFYINFMVVSIFGTYFLLFGQHNALTFKQFVMIVASSVLHVSEIILTAKALAIERPSVIGIVGYAQLVISPILDLVIFGTLPSFYTILGAALIIGCCVKLITLKN